MKPTGEGASATSADPDTNRLTGDSYQEYKCDNSAIHKRVMPK